MTKINPDQWVYIYGLRDPRTQEIRYIGCSIDPYLRLRSHTHGGNLLFVGTGPKRKVWIKTLVDSGLRPTVAILDRVRAQHRFECETFWIKHYQKLGTSLLNTITNSQRETFLDDRARVIAFVSSYIERHHQAPLNIEIAQATGINYAMVGALLNEMAKDGLIRRGRRLREIELLKQAS